MTNTNVEFISLTQMLTDLRRRLRDEADSRYPLLEKYAALQDASRSLQGRYGVQSVYTSLSFSSATYAYALPPFVNNISMIERQYADGVQSTGNSFVASTWREIPWFELRPTPQTNYLYIDKSYYSTEMRVWYQEFAPSLPVAEMTLGGAISPTQGSIPVNASVMTLSIQDYPSHGYAEMREGSNREVFFYEDVTATSFIKVTRGIYGVAASFNSATIVSPVIVLPPGRAGYNWMLNEARGQCYEMRLNESAIGDRGDVQWLTRWNSQRGQELTKLLSEQNRPAPRMKMGRRGRFL